MGKAQIQVEAVDKEDGKHHLRQITVIYTECNTTNKCNENESIDQTMMVSNNGNLHYNTYDVFIKPHCRIACSVYVVDFVIWVLNLERDFNRQADG